MTIDADGFRAVLGRLASGVCVVTMHAEGQDHGFTATSVTSLSLMPMLVLVCVAHHQRGRALLEGAGHFAVNLLDASQTELAVRFASGAAEERFRGVEVSRGVTGAPILGGGLGYLDCSIQQTLPGGDHAIVIGEVQSGAVVGAADPLLYFNRSWGTFLPE